MKFFIVTCLKEYQEDVARIFKQANINVFSATDIIGFKDNQSLNLLEDWFASGDEKFDSLILFSFTNDENAEHAMELIMKYNETNETGFPVRAFIVPVEKTSY
jgi:nitrogen regulatory protein PII